MRKIFALCLITALLVASAAFAQNVLISQVLYNPTGPEDKEWVELYNPTNLPINISNWKLYTYSTDAPDATIPASRTIQPRSFYLIGDLAWNASWPNRDHTEELFITNTNSGIQLRDAADANVDTVGWGPSPLFSEGTPAAVVVEGQSTARIIYENGTAIDTNNNIVDFTDINNPIPRNALVSLITSVCGDGGINGSEVCDGADLEGNTCIDLSYSNAGSLACSNTCFTFDTTGCANVCGDSNLEPGEQCDDGNLNDDDGCSATCQLEIYNCGNNIKEGIERCDGADFGSLSCNDYGYSNPNQLTCSPDCFSFVATSCTATCGDSINEPGEECDDGNLINGDGCSATCVSEIDNDLQPNYIRGIIIIDGNPAPQNTSYAVAVTTGENLGETFIDKVDDDIPAFLTGNGYFDTRDQTIFSTGETFRISAAACGGYVEGQFELGGNGDFEGNITELTCISPPVITNIINPAPTEIDEVIISADVFDNSAVNSVLINFSVNNGSFTTVSASLNNGPYTSNLGIFNALDTINYTIIAEDDFGNKVTSNSYVIAILPYDFDGDGFTSDMDCDENNALVNPGAIEVCNLIDDNCDGSIDESFINIFYEDLDNDTHGSTVTTVSCTQPDGFVLVAGDCNDNDPTVNPGAADICNSVDDDCNSNTTDGSGETAPLNSNQHGVCFQSSQFCSNGSWTDVYTPILNYELTELSCDSLDNNCDNNTDENLTTDFFADLDNDTFGDINTSIAACSLPENYTADSLDCNGDNNTIHPGAAELCNGIDDNCDGAIDESFPDFDNDTIPDCTDPDDDNDNVPDVTDEFPFDPTRWVDLLGDLNNDNMVDEFDFFRAVNALGTGSGDPGYLPDADINLDGQIDEFDVFGILNRFT